MKEKHALLLFAAVLLTAGFFAALQSDGYAFSGGIEGTAAEYAFEVEPLTEHEEQYEDVIRNKVAQNELAREDGRNIGAIATLVVFFSTLALVFFVYLSNKRNKTES
ncbi:hypothetical protein MM300_18495 [Evansella sp. LMS18]|jgi:hypothetical protein|uniref:hypothetical protein n=1 Tax=Evansella sp. LMS18 TaxID=2924033 RepID=UPI0020D015F9|nr:hypothetical protein [Evansella sp. LMS18]UTR09852.1 hypothetical protein MM300_18495 [Evansella sp. LMS18]